MDSCHSRILRFLEKYRNLWLHTCLPVGRESRPYELINQFSWLLATRQGHECFLNNIKREFQTTGLTRVIPFVMDKVANKKRRAYERNFWNCIK
jgi:hypothetical protein